MPRKYVPSQAASKKLSQAGVTTEAQAAGLVSFISQCPNPSDELFVDFIFSVLAADSATLVPEYDLSTCIHPTRQAIEQALQSGYKSDFLSAYIIPGFIMHCQTSALLPIDIDKSFESYLTTRFSLIERETQYGWYPSIGLFQELVWRGCSQSMIHEALNEFRLLHCDDRQSLDEAFRLHTINFRASARH